jgi:multidrug efflux pump subunit AcrA (membrane-fusion protein)
MRPVIIIAAIMAVLLAAGGWYWFGHRSPAASFRTARVERGDLRVTISATGTVEPGEDVDVGVQIAGQVKSLGQDPKEPARPVDYGTAVEQGTVLARIDDAPYAADVAQSAAAVDAAKANQDRAEADVVLTQAERDFKRAQDLQRSPGAVHDGKRPVRGRRAPQRPARAERGLAVAAATGPGRPRRASRLRRQGPPQGQGQGRDRRLLAPWTTIKSRISGGSLGSVNQSAGAAAAAAAGNPTAQTVNTLNRLYPSQATSLYPIPSQTQQADTPLPARFTNVDQIMVAAETEKLIPEAIRQITGVLHERHRVRPGQPVDFNIRDMTEMTKTLASTTTLMTNLLLCVALISLVAGGVGIMNIILVSVTERTHEIGLRMAVGARGRDILQQFLVEAVVLCLLGGALGILFGWFGSAFVRLVLQWPTETSWPAVVASVLVSATVGIVFGYSPAWNASCLDPIDALRYE